MGRAKHYEEGEAVVFVAVVVVVVVVLVVVVVGAVVAVVVVVEVVLLLLLLLSRRLIASLKTWRSNIQMAPKSGGVCHSFRMFHSKRLFRLSNGHCLPPCRWID